MLKLQLAREPAGALIIDSVHNPQHGPVSVDFRLKDGVGIIYIGGYDRVVVAEGTSVSLTIAALFK